MRRGVTVWIARVLEKIYRPDPLHIYVSFSVPNLQDGFKFQKIASLVYYHTYTPMCALFATKTIYLKNICLLEKMADGNSVKTVSFAESVEVRGGEGQDAENRRFLKRLAEGEGAVVVGEDENEVPEKIKKTEEEG